MPGEVIIYTDGGCDPNPGPGGWAALIIEGKTRRELSGAEEHSTNNRMELTAAIEALRIIEGNAKVTLFTDSQYLKRGIDEWMPRWLAKNWRTTSGPVANKDLWQELLMVSGKHQVSWQWLRGHTGNLYNERVDRLCRVARSSLRPLQKTR
ncbi:MAG TPA: ribonuclease HI [Anaerolineaceae bacterium]|nr:ribonuclease HI [Anaerolineaceae bacterium]